MNITMHHVKPNPKSDHHNTVSILNITLHSLKLCTEVLNSKIGKFQLFKNFNDEKFIENHLMKIYWEFIMISMKFKHLTLRT